MANGLSKFFRLVGLYWIIIIQITPSTVFAEDDLSIIQYTPNYVSIDYGFDNDHGRDRYIFANLGISLRDRVILGVGDETQTVSRSEESLANKTYLLGYNYIPHYQAQFGAEYEFWGDRDKVTVDSFRVFLAFNAGPFSIAVTPEFRKIKVNNDSDCDEDIDSGSARIDLSFDIFKNYSFSLGYVSYDYSNNLTDLSSCVATSERLTVESRIDSVANDNQLTLGLDYYRKSEAYGGNYTQSKTALKSEKSRTLSFYASTDRLDDWTLTATTGVTENLDDSTTLFISGTVTYYW